GVYCELHAHDVSEDFIRAFAPRGIILSGSHASAYETDTPRAPDAVFELGVPVLGICYGMQTMAAQLGGKVEMGHVREFGYAEVRARGHTRLLAGFTVMASTDSCPIAGMADENRHYYGVQFHPEVTHTLKGKEILERF